MGLFNRKKKNQEEESTFPKIEECQHKWQDFPWYIEGTWYSDRNSYEFDIIEPYVCLRCHKRMDKVLSHVQRIGNSKEAEEMVNDVKKQYNGRIFPRAEVEDMIQDTILIDPTYLKYFYMLNGGKNPSVSTAGYRDVTEDEDIKLKL